MIEAQPILDQPISNARGTKACAKYSKLIEDNKVVKDWGTKQGLTLYELKGDFGPVFVLAEGTKVVAYALLDSEAYDGLPRMFYVSNLFVTSPYRGKGLAVVLHLVALQKFKRLASDKFISLGALKAFKAVERYGYKVNLLNANEGKTVAYTWGPNGVPQVDGKPINELDDDFILYV